MRQSVFYSFFLSLVALFFIQSTQCITVTIQNKTDSSVTLAFEYRLDQFFTDPETKRQAFIPHTNNYHFFETIAPQQEVHVPLKFTKKCTREHCYLEENLQNSGYKRTEKRVNGLISLNYSQQVYEFSQRAITGQKIICTLLPERLKVALQ